MASAVATPLEKQFSTIPAVDSMTSTSSLGSTPITLQFALDRNIDAAAQDVQAAISRRAAPAAAADDDAADVPQGQSGRLADLLSSRSPRRRCRCRRSTSTPRTRSRSASRRSRRRAGQRLRSRRSTPCASISIRTRWPARGLGIDRSRSAVGSGNVNLPTGTLYGPNRIYNVKVNGQLEDAAAFGDLIVELPERRAGATEGHRQRLRRRAERQGRRAGSTASAAWCWRSRSSRARTRSRSSRTSSDLPAFEKSCRPASTCRRHLRPLAEHPRVGRRREVQPAARARARRAW